MLAGLGLVGWGWSVMVCAFGFGVGGLGVGGSAFAIGGSVAQVARLGCGV